MLTSSFQDFGPARSIFELYTPILEFHPKQGIFNQKSNFWYLRPKWSILDPNSNFVSWEIVDCELLTAHEALESKHLV